MNYYRRYVGDYLRDTSRLSMVEHGAYNLMLDYYYADEQPLPLDHEEVYRIVRALKPEERKAVDKILSVYFEPCDDGYRNGRADEELSVATPVIEAARQNGKLGGRPKKNPANNPGNNPDENPGITQPDTQDEPAGVPVNNHPPTSNLQPPAATPQPPTTTKAQKRNGHAAVAAFVPPDWVPKTQWDAWLESRKKKRNPPTVFAMEMAVAKLEQLREQGFHPAQVLAQSAFNGWAGLFEVKAQS